MAKFELNAGDACYIKMKNGKRFLGEFLGGVYKTGGAPKVFFAALDLTKGEFRQIDISDGNVLLEQLVPVDQKLWDKAKKVRGMYLSALGSIGDTCEKEQPKTAADEDE